MRHEIRKNSDIIYALWLKKKKKNFTLFYSHYTSRINFRQLIRGHLNCLLPEVSFRVATDASYSDIKFPREFIILNIIKVIYDVHYAVLPVIPFYSGGQRPNRLRSHLIAITARSNGFATIPVR